VLSASLQDKVSLTQQHFGAILQLTFKQLTRHDIPSGYAILVETSNWLKGRGLPSWQMPKAVFSERVYEGWIYGAFSEKRLVGVVSLTQNYRPAPWADLLPQRYLWLSTLNVARDTAGLGLGSFLIAESEKVATTSDLNVIFLECYYGDGKLPDYYARHGFEWIERRIVVFDDGVEHDDVLMQKAM
jgi:GNAT superfamily N-acetyltransferase